MYHFLSIVRQLDILDRKNMKKDVLTLVQTILTRKCYHGTVSYGNTSEVINKYFDRLEETLVENDLLEKPYQIFNCDESGFPLDRTAPKVVLAREDRNTHTVETK